MRDPIIDVQQAIYERLTIGAGKVAYEVLDGIPPDTENNYVEIQSVSSISNSAKQCPVHICMFFINCWSLSESNLIPGQMLNAVSESITFSDSLVTSPLTVANFTYIGAYRTGSRVEPVQDIAGFKRKGILEIEIWVQQEV